MNQLISPVGGSETPIFTMPNELLEQALLYLDTETLLQVAPLINKYIREVIKSSTVLQIKLFATFPTTFENVKNRLHMVQSGAVLFYSTTSQGRCGKAAGVFNPLLVNKSSMFKGMTRRVMLQVPAQRQAASFGNSSCESMLLIQPPPKTFSLTIYLRQKGRGLKRIDVPLIDGSITLQGLRRELERDITRLHPEVEWEWPPREMFIYEFASIIEDRK